MSNIDQSVTSHPPGRVMGIGGVFIKARDPKALSEWYRDILGMPVQSWGGATLRVDSPDIVTKAAWRVFDETSDNFAPSTSAFMINYVVDDMDAMIERLQLQAVTIIKNTDDDTFGRFVWVMDPEGNKVELWKPKSGE